MRPKSTTGSKSIDVCGAPVDCGRSRQPDQIENAWSFVIHVGCRLRLNLQNSNAAKEKRVNTSKDQARCNKTRHDNAWHEKTIISVGQTVLNKTWKTDCFVYVPSLAQSFFIFIMYLGTIYSQSRLPTQGP